MLFCKEDRKKHDSQRTLWQLTLKLEGRKSQGCQKGMLAQLIVLNCVDKSLMQLIAPLYLLRVKYFMAVAFARKLQPVRFSVTVAANISISRFYSIKGNPVRYVHSVRTVKGLPIISVARFFGKTSHD